MLYYSIFLQLFRGLIPFYNTPLVTFYKVVKSVEMINECYKKIESEKLTSKYYLNDAYDKLAFAAGLFKILEIEKASAIFC